MWWGEYVPTYSDATNSILDAEEPCFNRHLDSGVNFTSRLSSPNIPLIPTTGPVAFSHQAQSLTKPQTQRSSNWFITQEERQWPSDAVNPKYYWDCMFRKVNGVVEVAIFVYRILGDVPGGLVDADSDGFALIQAPPPTWCLAWW